MRRRTRLAAAAARLSAPVWPSHLLFVKTKKCAGTTVALVVRRIARLANISMFSVAPWEWSKSHPCASLATHPPFRALLDTHPRHIGFSYECSRTSLEPMVSAHMRGALALTIVREPLARALAAFYHFGVGFQQKPNTTAAKLAWLQKERDSLFQYIRRPADATPAAALANYDVVLITERLDESMVRLRLRLGLPQHAVLYFDGKTSHGRSKDGVLRRPPHVPLAWEEPAFRDAAAAVVRGSADAELYALAVSAHERAVAALQPNFADELGAFRTLLGEARQACTRAAWRRSGRGTDGCYNHGRENGCLYTCLDGFK